MPGAEDGASSPADVHSTLLEFSLLALAQVTAALAGEYNANGVDGQSASNIAYLVPTLTALHRLVDEFWWRNEVCKLAAAGEVVDALLQLLMQVSKCNN